MEIGNLSVPLTIDVSKFQQSANQAQAKAKAFSSNIKSAFNTLNQSPLGQITQQVTGFSLSTVSAAAIVSKALSEMIQFTKDAINENTEYVQSMMDISQITGDTVENMSRLTQVADDLTISESELNTALEAGAKKGLDMSARGIQTLADQYNALATPQEKATFLNDNFGKSGLEMGKLLSQGADGISKAMAAINSNLVVTDAAALKTKQYKKAIDDLNDAMSGLKYQLSNEITPELTKTITIMAYLIEQAGKADSFISKWEKISQWITPINAQATLLKKGIGAITDAAYDNITATGEADKATKAYSDRLTAQANAYKALHPEIALTTDEINNITKANESLISGVASWSKTMESYQSNLTDLYSQQAAIEEDLNTARNQGYSETGSKITGYISQLNDINTKINDVKKQHEIETYSVILGFMQQKLAVDGLDDSETTFLLSQGEKWGVYAQGTVDAYKKMEAEADAFLAHRQSSEYDNTVTVTTVYQTIQQTVGRSTAVNSTTAAAAAYNSRNLLKPNANGGSWSIPSSYGNEGFVMGGVATASAGETVSVSSGDLYGLVKQLIEVTKNNKVTIDYVKMARATRDVVLSEV